MCTNEMKVMVVIIGLNSSKLIAFSPKESKSSKEADVQTYGPHYFKVRDPQI